ncbi:HNH endonuclease [Beutenbergia cavernae DSM 12333]|uniref:HNH endonuclease n=1 Tax=Beutenbergia cavernae (strain ATCC BAA-8 / DSM 12333 / CCUG 43141 / JCM 11478 / NBRC 16432 / NCIMB 13614 / HKI 0122) TaxID=471853 RepID=C5BVY2_BEUC1|nr:HNH endonuclease signature motif containing protein [Beutenbergia cavernae]ACQ80583.1 HNH endonuclease [Beutenbergia cavernae DSM 12333]
MSAEVVPDVLRTAASPANGPRSSRALHAVAPARMTSPRGSGVLRSSGSPSSADPSGSAASASASTSTGDPDVVSNARAVLLAVEALGVAVSDVRSGREVAEEAALREAVAVLDRAEALIRVNRGHVLGVIREEGRWAVDGDRDFAGWRARTSGQGRGAARREATLADGLDALPGTAEAVATGEVSLGHADVLTSLLAEASPAVKERLASGGESELLPTAVQTDVPTFRKKAQAWAGRIDADQADRDAESVRARRFLRITGGNRGTRIEGLLDPLAGATLRTALEALTPAPAASDLRTPDQRRADALVDLAGRVLASGTEKPGAQVRPHLNLLVPYDTWLLLRRRPTSTCAGEAAGDPTVGDVAMGGEAVGGEAVGGEAVGDVAVGDVAVGAAPGVRSGSRGSGSADEVPLAELEDGTLVPFGVLETLACDCEMTRIVLDADGVPLDVGQTQRSYTRELRRAALARDRHCRWPGCSIRASWCEVHHRIWYSHGGATSLENAITLCVFHHHEVHRRHLGIDVIPGGHHFRRRDGSTLGTSTRLQDDLLVPAMRPTVAAPSAVVENVVPERQDRSASGSAEPLGSDPPRRPEADLSGASPPGGLTSPPAAAPGLWNSDEPPPW